MPLTQPILAVVPKVSELYEGNDLYLICRVEGTPPVTFKWYRDGEEKPLNTTTSNTVFADYGIPSLSKEHSGKYYCEAVNHANKPVKSDLVYIEGVWKCYLFKASFSDTDFWHATFYLAYITQYIVFGVLVPQYLLCDAKQAVAVMINLTQSQWGLKIWKGFFFVYFCIHVI